MDATVDDALFTERMLARLSAAFGLLATVLATIGLYGVMSYTVARRTREIGIRMALGAERRSVIWLVLKEVGLLILAGIALGVPVGAESQPTRQVSVVRHLASRSADDLSGSGHAGPGRTACGLYSGEPGVTRPATPGLAMRVEERSDSR